MARLARLFCPDVPHLLQARVEAGSQPVTVPVLDAWAKWLEQESQARGISVHGWAFIPEEILLLVTPRDADSLRHLMQTLGRRIARQRGGGKVFAGRYRSALIEPGAWVLPTLVWLESAPVRHGLATDPEHWRWSSARAHTGAGVQLWLSMHADYWRCGNTPYERQAYYRNLIHEGLAPTMADRIEATLAGQWALGSESFIERVEQRASRRVTPRSRGRPRSIEKAPPAADSAG